MNDDLTARLEPYLANILGVPDLEIANLARIPGGASRETYRFRARYMREGTEIERGLILRRDPPASLIETERTTEFRAYRAFHGLGLPVPEPIALEEGTEVLDRPFFVMEEIENCQVGSILSSNPYGEMREKIGRQFFSNLGRIARADVDEIGLGNLEGERDPEKCWSHEVERWEKVIDEDEREPQPIARAALRWLKRNPPPPAQKIAVVHGDYRTGNFLYDAGGNIRAILDWEMAHLGDPLEDLGWAIDPLWSHGDPSRPAGTIPRGEALAIWEKESGLKLDTAALAWWEIFASLKGLAIWISAAREYAEMRNADPVNAFSGWFCLAFHNKVLADRLGAA
ncbi:MAG TPA: phosphotransferase family protein [Rhizomicrobium sp.]|nr:phosphotransferase family protein [Rhizomicrobium sp.]